MWLFGRKSGRAEARPALVRSAGGGVLGDWPRGYEAQVRAAYLGNAVAQRSVRMVADACGSVTVLAAEQGHVAERIVKPVLETVAAQMLLHGNAYLLIGCGADGVPEALYPLRPERVTVEADAGGWPVAYRYQAGTVTTRYPVAGEGGAGGVVHLKALHPLDDHYGVGSLGAAAGPVAIHNAATQWNKALLDNAARPSGALVYDPGEPGAVLSRDQYDRLKAEMEASFAGSSNAGRPMLLEGGLKWQAMSLSPADMDFVGLKAAAAREIALAFGVPPMLLGLPGDNTYANYAEASRALWRLTVLPLVARLLDGVSEGLAAWWPGLALVVDLDAVPALSGDRAALWGQVAAADFLSRAEKRELLGFAVEVDAAGASAEAGA
ncbi:phage portal protein [Sphingomonas montana]|uniref:phage portal protein n=1 Tax=Sphingomonas montana TaxID=1843236 RepID=UPI00096D0437|nr:phage portal protein [Sphingomonas montana]